MLLKEVGSQHKALVKQLLFLVEGLSIVLYDLLEGDAAKMEVCVDHLPHSRRKLSLIRRKLCVD